MRELSKSGKMEPCYLFIYLNQPQEIYPLRLKSATNGRWAKSGATVYCLCVNLFCHKNY